jgi:hypothetical protein
MPRTPAAPREPADYRHWKSRAAALLERHGLPLGVMRERDLRKLYIGGATPMSRSRVLVGEGARELKLSNGGSDAQNINPWFSDHNGYGVC